MSTGLESLIMQLSALLQENTECMKDIFERIEKVEEKVTILTHLEMKRQGVKIPHASISLESSMKKLKNQDSIFILDSTQNLSFILFWIQFWISFMQGHDLDPLFCQVWFQTFLCISASYCKLQMKEAKLWFKS